MKIEPKDEVEEVRVHVMHISMSIDEAKTLLSIARTIFHARQDTALGIQQLRSPDTVVLMGDLIQGLQNHVVGASTYVIDEKGEATVKPEETTDNPFKGEANG